MAVPAPKGFSRTRRWAILLNVLVSCVAMLAVVVMINYLASRHFSRIHWTQDTRFQLTPQTLRVLESLTNKVKVTVYFEAKDPREDPLFSWVKNLLKEYQHVSPQWLDVEYVDYNTSPHRAAAVKGQYKLSAAGDKNLVIFDSTNNPPHVVYGTELSDYDLSGVMAGGREVRPIAFKGERLFTAAILGVSDPKPFKAYFVGGHSEHSPGSDDEQSGYSKFLQLLQEKNVSASPLSLQTNDVPADAQLLIIAGPRSAFTPLELERVDRYLAGGGRAFILLMNTLSGASMTGLEKVLAKWGVEVRDNLVTDRLQNKKDDSPYLVVSQFGEHPITKPLLNAQLLLVMAQSVRHLPAVSQVADTTRVTELAFTSEKGRAIRNVRNQKGTVEGTGRIPLMVAVEKGAIQGVKTDRGATRMVVAGDSMMLVDGNIDNLANHEFANLAVNWLLNREYLLAISPRPVLEYKVFIPETSLRKATWILLTGIPGGVLSIGLLVWLRRRQ